MKRLVVIALFSVLLTGCVKQSDYDELSEKYEELQTKYEELDKNYQFEKERPDWADLFNKTYSFESATIEMSISLSNEGKTSFHVKLTDSSNNKSDTYYEELIHFLSAYSYALYLESGIDNFFFNSYMENRDDYLSTCSINIFDSYNTVDAYNRDSSATLGKQPDWFESKDVTDTSYIEWLLPILEQYKTDSQYCFDFLERYKQ